MKKKFNYQKLTAVSLGVFVLYATGLLSVFAGFVRTVGNQFVSPSDKDTFKYGYGYGNCNGNLGW